MNSTLDNKKNEYMRNYMAKRRLAKKDTWNDQQKTLRAKKNGAVILQEEEDIWKEDMGNVIALRKLLDKLKLKRPQELGNLLTQLSSSLSSSTSSLISC